MIRTKIVVELGKGGLSEQVLDFKSSAELDIGHVLYSTTLIAQAPRSNKESKVSLMHTSVFWKIEFDFHFFK